MCCRACCSCLKYFTCGCLECFNYHMLSIFTDCELRVSRILAERIGIRYRQIVLQMNSRVFDLSGGHMFQPLEPQFLRDLRLYNPAIDHAGQLFQVNPHLYADRQLRR